MVRSESASFFSLNSRFEMDHRSRLHQNAAFDYSKPADSPGSYTGDFSFGEGTDRRFAYTRQASMRQSAAAVEAHTPRPELTRCMSSIDIPPGSYLRDYRFSNSKGTGERVSPFSIVSLVLGGLRSGNKQMRRLLVLISLNVAYSTAELFIGLFSGRIGMEILWCSAVDYHRCRQLNELTVFALTND